MENDKINIESIVNYWKESSEQNYVTMHNLLKSGDNSWALFMGHLVIEKLLKAMFVKNKEEHPIFTHDLLRLSKKIDLELTVEFEEWFDEITTFNLNTRYDDYKQSFYKRCTEDFTVFWIDKIEIIRKWLISQL